VLAELRLLTTENMPSNLDGQDITVAISTEAVKFEEGM
jgi:hypothetical protein